MSQLTLTDGLQVLLELLFASSLDEMDLMGDSQTSIMS